MLKSFYDSTDLNSIYEYAKKMEGKTFRKIIQDYEFMIQEQDISAEIYENKRRKGGLGELVEHMYFGYEPNSDMGPDFKEAGLELKVTPYKKNKNGTFSSKERMIITMINYFQIIDESFYESNLWEKSRRMLIVFYLWEDEITSRLDYQINYTHLYRPVSEDLKIIINDFEKIKRKVKDGLAHELSEGDTMYLGAATKAATSADLRDQPCSGIPAKPRAFSFKNSYMTYILNNYVLRNEKDNQKEKPDKILKDVETDEFEKYVLNRIKKNIGMKDTELFKMYYDVNGKSDLERIDKSKGKYSNLAFRMLGVKSNKAEEFEKANVIVKSIRVEKTGKITESLSFPTFIIKELVEEEWETSTIYNYFSSAKFLFMVFERTEEGRYQFKDATFWNMPMSVIETDLKEDWENIVDVFKKGLKFTPMVQKGGRVVIGNNLPSKNETNIIHVRPHAAKAAYQIEGKRYGSGNLERDSDELPNGDRMTKQCFWINNDYLKGIISAILS